MPASVNGVWRSSRWRARGQRAIGLDIATPEGKEILLSLVDEADVFLTNLLPGARRKLGIEPEDIMSRNPRVIYGQRHCPRTARGARRSWRLRRNHVLGAVGAAIGATMPGQEFPSPMPGPGFGDMQSGMALAGGISAALFARERNGRGVLVDCSLMSAGLWAMSMTVSGASVLDVDELPYQGHEGSPNPLTNVYRTKDGHFIALGFLQADKYWPEFCLAVDTPRVDRRRTVHDHGGPTGQLRSVRSPARRAWRAHPGRVGEPGHIINRHDVTGTKAQHG